jgi:spectinomycin phosphotransferase
VRSAAEHVRGDQLVGAVRQEWGLQVSQFEYFPEGGGAYHWVAHGEEGRRWFITCDDLDIKPWLGSNRDAVFAGLLTAYGAAVELRDRAGLLFVVAPFPTIAGEPAARIDDRHSAAVFPYVSGVPGVWGQPAAPDERHRLVEILADLHRATRMVSAVPRRGLQIPARRAFEANLQSLDHPWNASPLAEAARRELVGHAELIAHWLAALDQLIYTLDSRGVDLVITHGEPHPGNLIRNQDEFAFVDWDTVALARPERDLWMLDDSDGEARAAYEEVTGQALDPKALAAYRLAWALADIAAFTSELRGGHGPNADTEKALAALQAIFTEQEPSPYGVDLRSL